MPDDEDRGETPFILPPKQPKKRPPKYRVCLNPACGQRFATSPGRFMEQQYHSEACKKAHERLQERTAKRVAEAEALFAEASEELRRKAVELERRDALGLFANTTPPTEEEKEADPRLRIRRGPLYEKFKAAGYLERIEAGAITPSDAARMFQTSEANVSGWIAAYAEDERNRVNNRRWAPSNAAKTALADFATFRRNYFSDEDGKDYVTTDYHMEWIKAILHAMEVGGRLQILAPPRHGKSDLLIHFCIWMMLRRPNIRIIWIGLNDDIASQSTDVIRDHLETNKRLIRDFLPEGDSFKPESGTGRPWQAAKFTLATRTISEKSVTMRAQGKKGKTLSLDADLIIVDDIIDHDSTVSPAERDHDRTRMNTQISSRKENKTALMAIGSRQHHDDLWGVLEKNRSWVSIVAHAHDPNCTLPRHEGWLPEGHDEWGEKHCDVCGAHQECLLWPERRTMAWLEDQRFAMDDDDHFEMVYNNRTKPASEAFITQRDIEATYDRDRPLGHVPPGCILIAGLDPASVNVQAAFLWAYHRGEDRRYMVDIDTEKGGGLSGARRIIQLWHEKYGLQMWVIERNNYQAAILEDTDLTKFCAANGITLKPHFTDRYNKWDPTFGVLKQFTLFRQRGPVFGADGRLTEVMLPKINLPYGDPQAQERTHLYRDRLMAFEGATRGVETDVVMAAWFPETEIRTWQATASADIQYEYDQSSYDIDMLGDYYYPDAI